MLCSKQTLANYHPILPLAETASVFCEMIVTDMLLKRETDKTARQALLTDKLEDIFATSHRQNMFSRFEMETHKRISDSILSNAELCRLYKQELKKMFGESVKYTEEFDWEWSSIPHMIDWPFYVYSYNFGNLLVMALYQQYKEEGRRFVPRFKEFLALGSSKSPKDITRAANADITHPEFWKKSLKYIQSLIDQLQALVDA
jgi:oligoendopeptidase F